jgi:hypothetical protein
MTNNYFRNGRHVFFFGSHDEESITAAWRKATESNRLTRPAIWRPIKLEGFWTGCHIIGMSPVGSRPTDPIDMDKWRERYVLHKKMWEACTSHTHGV